MPPRLVPFFILLALAGCQSPTTPSAPLGKSLMTSPLPPVYSPDNADGTYRNPILFADYSDPDVIRVNDDFFLTASSFSCFPGLPILHSRDLVNWQIIGHALQRYPAPLDKNFDAPNHGAGVWAPSIRFHNNRFWIFFGDPDLGIFMTTAKNPAGPWAPLTRVKEAKGWIDCCPLWDDDGNAYLVHAFANSRAGIANVLDICRMSPDGTHLLDEGTRIYDGGQTGATNRPANPALAGAGRYTTVEGPKLYKRNGFYYIMAPGGGVTAGYQLVFRSKNILGPYVSRIVLDQGTTKINGPHQGGWVTTAGSYGKGTDDWFIHFQEILPYGRILHLQPVKWVNDWPVMGDAPAGAEKGQPVLTHSQPVALRTMRSLAFGRQEGLDINPVVPQTSDEFDNPTLGLQWQWWANFNPAWSNLTARPGFLRLTPVSLDKPTLLYNRPNLLLQKFPAETFTVTTRLDVANLGEGETAGLVLAGKTMASLTCSRLPNGIKVVITSFNANNRNAADAIISQASTNDGKFIIDLEMRVAPKASATLQPAATRISASFQATPSPPSTTPGSEPKSASSATPRPTLPPKAAPTLIISTSNRTRSVSKAPLPRE